MKRTTSLLMILFVAFGFCTVVAVNAAGTKDPGSTLNVLYTADTVNVAGVSHFKSTVVAFNKLYPDTTVVLNKVDLTDGSTLTMDAMIAAGTPPNVYTDNMVRIAKYLIPSFVVDLSTIVDTAPYVDLKPYYVGAALLALPLVGEAQGMAINLDVMDAIGYTVPTNWTIEDFLTMAAKVKAKYGDKVYPTGMFAANQSGDFLMNGWHAAFGVKWYGDNYDKAIVDATPVYTFYQLLMSLGYIPPNSATLTDDDYVLDWSLGKYAATAFLPSWMPIYFASAMKQGLIKQPHRVKYVAFPHAPGVTKVPTYFANAAVIAIKSGNADTDIKAAKFAELLNSAEMQQLIIDFNNTLSTRTDVKASNNEYTAQTAAIVAANGFQDVGITDSRFTERRALQFPIIQRVLMGKVGPATAANEFRTKLSNVIK